MCWLRGALERAVRLREEVPGLGLGDAAVDHRTRLGVPPADLLVGGRVGIVAVDIRRLRGGAW